MRDGRGTAVLPYRELIKVAAMRRDVWRRLIEDIGLSAVLLVGVLYPVMGIWLAVWGSTTPEPYRWTWAISYIFISAIFLLRILKNQRSGQKLHELQERIRRKAV
jgi:hypothetical protein